MFSLLLCALKFDEAYLLVTVTFFSTCVWCDFSHVIAKLDMIVLAIDDKIHCVTFLTFCSHMTTAYDVINTFFLRLEDKQLILTQFQLFSTMIHQSIAA